LADVEGKGFQPTPVPSRYQGVNLAFNEYGEFNQHLDDQQMVKFYTDVIDGKIVPPRRTPKPKKIIVNHEN
jgi:hypothetical protein